MARSVSEGTKAASVGPKEPHLVAGTSGEELSTAGKPAAAGKRRPKTDRRLWIKQERWLGSPGYEAMQQIASMMRISRSEM